MDKGRIIFLNGVTSAGKTSIVDTLQNREDVFFMLLRMIYFRRWWEIKPHYRQLLEILKDNPLDIVEVYCPLDICRQRNIARGDRYEMQSEEQDALMAENIRYSTRVDTSIYTPDECAEKIIRELFH